MMVSAYIVTMKLIWRKINGNGIMICYKIVRIVGDEVTTRYFMIESQADDVYNDWLEKVDTILYLKKLSV